MGDRPVYESHFTVYETRGLKSRGYLTNCRANIIRLEKNYTLSRKFMRHETQSKASKARKSIKARRGRQSNQSFQIYIHTVYGTLHVSIHHLLSNSAANMAVEVTKCWCVLGRSKRVIFSTLARKSLLLGRSSLCMEGENLPVSTWFFEDFIL